MAREAARIYDEQMGIAVQLSGQACGATVSGVDIGGELEPDQIAELRALWLEHQVLSFPSQDLTDDDLERFTQYFGPFGVDPYVAPIPGRSNVIAIARSATETAPVFAESWHTDWSFQEQPPSGTCLYGLVVPPEGGDTLFTNQHAALAAMPTSLRDRLAGLQAVHSARGGYAPSGLYGEGDVDNNRAMQITPSVTAMATQNHELFRDHPETGVPAIFGCVGYIIGFVGMPDDEARELLMELYAWQTKEEFVYRHVWQRGTLVMWDNRSVLHRATGGYDGHERLLHRTTIAAVSTR